VAVEFAVFLFVVISWTAQGGFGRFEVVAKLAVLGTG
jgi:hypothetical protein